MVCSIRRKSLSIIFVFAYCWTLKKKSTDIIFGERSPNRENRFCWQKKIVTRANRPLSEFDNGNSWRMRNSISAKLKILHQKIRPFLIDFPVIMWHLNSFFFINYLRTVHFPFPVCSCVWGGPIWQTGAKIAMSFF